jgi:hypothetical protein
MKVFANIQSVSALAKAKMESAGMGVVFNMDSLKVGEEGKGGIKCVCIIIIGSY